MLKQIIFVFNNFQHNSHNTLSLKIISALQETKMHNLLIVSFNNDGPLFKKFITKRIPIVSAVNFVKQSIKIKNHAQIILVSQTLRGEYFAFLLRLIYGRHKLYHVSTRHNYGFVGSNLRVIIKNLLYSMSNFFPNQIIVVSEYIKKNLPNWRQASVNTITVIPNGVPSIGRKRKIPRADDLITLIYTGKLSERKNLRYLLRLISQEIKRYPQLKCYIIGDGYLKKKLISVVNGSPELKDRVIFTGYLSDVRPYLQRSDILVSASKREGLPLSVLEAMSYGVACFISDIESHRELIRDQVEGVLFPLDNIEVATKKLHQLIIGKELRKNIGNNAIEKVSTYFNEDQMLSRYKQFFASLDFFQ